MRGRLPSGPGEMLFIFIFIIGLVTVLLFGVSIIYSGAIMLINTAESVSVSEAQHLGVGLIGGFVAGYSAVILRGVRV